MSRDNFAPPRILPADLCDSSMAGIVYVGVDVGVFMTGVEVEDVILSGERAGILVEQVLV